MTLITNVKFGYLIQRSNFSKNRKDDLYGTKRETPNFIMKDKLWCFFNKLTKLKLFLLKHRFLYK
jgi:hypothetical protein